MEVSAICGDHCPRAHLFLFKIVVQAHKMACLGESCGSQCCEGLCGGQYALHSYQRSEANVDHVAVDRAEVPTECMVVIGKSAEGIHRVQRAATPADQFCEMPPELTRDSSENLLLHQELYLDGDQEEKQECAPGQSTIWTPSNTLGSESSQHRKSAKKLKAGGKSKKSGIRRLMNVYATFVQDRRESLQLRRMRSRPWPGANR